jgi:RNA polymerase sigma-70 factor (ECF subfamily)
VTNSLPEESEATLVERAARGDRAAFDQLATSRAAGLYSLARMVLRDDDLAGDALQETLVRAWRDLPRLRNRDRFSAWIHRLIVNACYDEMRRKRRSRFEVRWIDPDVGAQDDESRAVADHDQLARALSRLPIDQRVVVVMRYYLELPQAEIADVLGIPVGTVKSRTNHAMVGLRAVLEADMRVPIRADRETT